MDQKNSSTQQLGYYTNKTYIQTVTKFQWVEKQSSNILELIKQNSQYILITRVSVNNRFPVTYKIFDELNLKFDDLKYKGT
ncbi:hypothetical protein [Apibacter mensalis]|nr:hypothetical protein [Apibacter mensalis]